MAVANVVVAVLVLMELMVIAPLVLTVGAAVEDDVLTRTVPRDVVAILDSEVDVVPMAEADVVAALPTALPQATSPNDAANSRMRQSV